MPEKKTNFYKT